MLRNAYPHPKGGGFRSISDIKSRKMGEKLEKKKMSEIKEEERRRGMKIAVMMITAVLTLVIMSGGVLAVWECSDTTDCPSSCWDCGDRNPEDNINTCCDDMCGPLEDYKCAFDSSYSLPLTLDDEGCYGTQSFTDYQCCEGDYLQTASTTHLPNPTHPYYDFSSYTRDSECCSLGSTPYTSLTRNYTYIQKSTGYPAVAVVETIGSCCGEPKNIPAPEYNEDAAGCWKDNKKDNVPWDYSVGGESYTILTSTKSETCYECYDFSTAFSTNVALSQTCIDEGKDSCCYGECYNDAIADCCEYEGSTSGYPPPYSYPWGYCGNNSWLCEGTTPVCDFKSNWTSDWKCEGDMIEIYPNEAEVPERECKECEYVTDCNNLGFSEPGCCFGECYDAAVEHCCINSNKCESKACGGGLDEDLLPGDPGWGECCDTDGNGFADDCCGGEKPYCVEVTEFVPDLVDFDNDCERVEGIKEGIVQNTCAECRQDFDCIAGHGDEFRCCKLEGGDNRCYNSTEESCCAFPPIKDDIRCTEGYKGTYELSPGDECMGSISSTDCCGDPCIKCKPGCDGKDQGCFICAPVNADPLVLYEDVIENENYTFIFEDDPVKLKMYLEKYKVRRAIDILRTCWFDFNSYVPAQQEVLKNDIIPKAGKAQAVDESGIDPGGGLWGVLGSLIDKVFSPDDKDMLIGVENGPSLGVRFFWKASKIEIDDKNPKKFCQFKGISAWALFFKTYNYKRTCTEEGASEPEPKRKPKAKPGTQPGPRHSPKPRPISFSEGGWMESRIYARYGGENSLPIVTADVSPPVILSSSSSTISSATGTDIASAGTTTCPAGSENIKIDERLGIMFGTAAHFRFGLWKPLDALFGVGLNPFSGTFTPITGFDLSPYGIPVLLFFNPLTFEVYWATMIAYPLVKVALDYLVEKEVYSSIQAAVDAMLGNFARGNLKGFARSVVALIEAISGAMVGISKEVLGEIVSFFESVG